jgi:putative hemolysin
MTGGAVSARELWVILACLVLSCYFSASEAAFLSLSRARVQALLRKRVPGSAALRLWAKEPAGVLSSILIGNNLVNIALSALAADMAGRLLQHQAIAIAIGVTTLAILVFSEITPKVLAQRYAAPLASYGSHGIWLFYYLTLPVTTLFVLSTNRLIRATGGDPARDFAPVTVEELELMVTTGARTGSIGKLPADLMSRALSLTRRAAREVMIPRTRVVALEMEEGAREVAKQFNLHGHSRFPVYRGQVDEIIGVFHVKDLLAVPPEEWARFRLAEHLHPPYFIPETADLGMVLGEFQRRGIHMAVVVDEFGGVEGVVTLEDILAELVGDIRDEFDQGVLTVKKLPGGGIEVPGQTPMEDVLRLFPSAAGDVAAQTVAGLLLEATGRVPDIGESFALLGLRFTVTGADDRRVWKVRIEEPIL